MVVFVATHHNPQSAAPRQSDITPESFPGLEAIAQQKFDLPYYELSPALQSHVREEAIRRAGNDLLAALKSVCSEAKSWHTFHHGSSVVSCDTICACLPEMERAIALAEGRA